MTLVTFTASIRLPDYSAKPHIFQKVVPLVPARWFRLKNGEITTRQHFLPQLIPKSMKYIQEIIFLFLVANMIKLWRPSTLDNWLDSENRTTCNTFTTKQRAAQESFLLRNANRNALFTSSCFGINHFPMWYLGHHRWIIVWTWLERVETNRKDTIEVEHLFGKVSRALWVSETTAPPSSLVNGSISGDLPKLGGFISDRRAILVKLAYLGVRILLQVDFRRPFPLPVFP